MTKLEVSVDQFAQSGEKTLAEISAAAQGQGGGVANVIRDQSGKLVQVNLSLPPTASQNAIDSIAANPGAGDTIQYPAVIGNQNWDLAALGITMPTDSLGVWTSLIDTGANRWTVVDDSYVSAPHSLKVISNAHISHVVFVPNRAVDQGRTFEIEAKFKISSFAAEGGFNPSLLVLKWSVGNNNLRVGTDGNLINFTNQVTYFSVPENVWFKLAIRAVNGDTSALIFKDDVLQGLFPWVPENQPLQYQLSWENGYGAGRQVWMDDFKLTILA